jgi:hypothetical protein
MTEMDTEFDRYFPSTMLLEGCPQFKYPHSFYFFQQQALVFRSFGNIAATVNSQSPEKIRNADFASATGLQSPSQK